MKDKVGVEHARLSQAPFGVGGGKVTKVQGKRGGRGKAVAYSQATSRRCSSSSSKTGDASRALGVDEVGR